MVYKLLRSLYYKLPLKREVFFILKTIYKPSIRIAGYLKFKGCFKINIEGQNLWLYNNNSTLASLLFWKGTKGYEQQSIEIWAKLSKNGGIIFDVGANFGLFGLIAKAVNKSSNVHFFEPLSRNVKLIEQNLQLNKFDNSFINTCAVSKFNGEADFYDITEVENTVGSFDIEFVKSHKPSKNIISVKVPVLSLDKYINEKGINKVDLIKIDVEGSEVEVIEGFSECIKKFKPDILIELSNNATAEKINRFFFDLNLGYHFFEINEKKGLVPKRELHRGGSRNFLICKRNSFINSTI